LITIHYIVITKLLVNMDNPCKECPWFIKNKHNESIVSHSKKFKKKHNCHMKKKVLWEENPQYQCFGNKSYFKTI
jgi:hypothetical protein